AATKVRRVLRREIVPKLQPRRAQIYKVAGDVIPSEHPEAVLSGGVAMALPVPLLRMPPACAPSPSPNPCANSPPTTLTWDRGRGPPPRSPLHRRLPAQRTPERPSVCRSLWPHRCPRVLSGRRELSRSV